MQKVIAKFKNCNAQQRINEVFQQKYLPQKKAHNTHLVKKFRFMYAESKEERIAVCMEFFHPTVLNFLECLKHKRSTAKILSGRNEIGKSKLIKNSL